MIRLIVASLLLFSSSAIATDNLPPGGIGNESGEQLLARCEPALRMIEAGSDAGMNDTERIEATSCIGLVDGFIWGHAWSSWRKRSDMFFCAPDLFSAREGVPALVSYLRAHPDRLIQHAHLLIFAAFNHAYPCDP
jgi:Ssp1 endopeptidase immunity protein Rap1a